MVSNSQRKNTKDLKMATIIGVLLWLAIVVGMGYGWVLNIIWIVDQQVWIWSGESILSIAGVLVVPLGALMGYIN